MIEKTARLITYEYFEDHNHIPGIMTWLAGPKSPCMVKEKVISGQTVVETTFDFDNSNPRHLNARLEFLQRKIWGLESKIGELRAEFGKKHWWK